MQKGLNIMKEIDEQIKKCSYRTCRKIQQNQWFSSARSAQISQKVGSDSEPS